MNARTGRSTYYQYPLMDLRGTAYAIADGNGNILTSYVMDAFGRTLAGTGGSDPNVPNLLQYQTNWLTQQIGGKNYQLSTYRPYDPTLGIFTQRDFIGAIGDLNLYRAFRNNVVLLTDVLGLVGSPPPSTAMPGESALDVLNRYNMWRREVAAALKCVIKCIDPNNSYYEWLEGGHITTWDPQGIKPGGETGNWGAMGEYVPIWNALNNSTKISLRGSCISDAKSIVQEGVRRKWAILSRFAEFGDPKKGENPDELRETIDFEKKANAADTGCCLRAKDAWDTSDLSKPNPVACCAGKAATDKPVWGKTKGDHCCCICNLFEWE